ncbi:MAG: hypothetical protein ABIK73_07290 [candidate division WOR-3 bacterium]
MKENEVDYEERYVPLVFVKKCHDKIGKQPYMRQAFGAKPAIFTPQGVLECEIRLDYPFLYRGSYLKTFWKVKVFKKVGKTGSPYLLLLPREDGELLIAEYLETRKVSEEQVQEALAVGLITNGGGWCVLLRKPKKEDFLLPKAWETDIVFFHKRTSDGLLYLESPNKVMPAECEVVRWLGEQVELKEG